MKIGKTNRGFRIVEFEDVHGNYCSIQESSSGETLWLGRDYNQELEYASPRMLLTREQAKTLGRLLNEFANNGELPDQC